VELRPSHGRRRLACVEPVQRRLPERIVLVAALAVLLGVIVYPKGAPALSPQRADWTLTPGVANPDVTQGSIGETICAQGWTQTIRPPSSYTDELKLEQMKAYGRRGTASDYQEDHLISLELGGDPTDPRNLWPEPIERAREVDQTENELNAAVCSRRMTLEEGQSRESALKHTQG
jgi:hypothetical protein